MATTLTYQYAFTWTDIYKGIGPNGPYYDVTFWVLGDWQKDGDNFCNQLLGYTSWNGTSGVYVYAYQMPLSPNLTCQSAECVGVGVPNLNATGYPSYSTGFLVKARFEVPRFNTVPTQDPYNYQGIDQGTPILWCTQNLDFQTDVIVLPSTQYKWQSDNSPCGVPIRIEVGITTMDLTFHQVPYLPSTLIRSLRNHVNTMTVLGSQPGYLLFKGARSQLTMQSNGSYSRTLQLIFQERDYPWNQLVRRDSLQWDTPTDSSGHTMYSSADLTPLIQIMPA